MHAEDRLAVSGLTHEAGQAAAVKARPAAR